MNLFAWIRARYTWTWVGTVEGVSHIVDDKGNMIPGGDRRCYWNLYQRGDGKRDFKLIGTKLNSAYSLSLEAKVKAWRLGGPLPPLCNPPSPEKTKAKLLVFPGGKE